MEAAKRIYDNSYNQRQETAALAKAYLDEQKVQPEKPAHKQEKQLKNGRVCTIIGVMSSLVYCMLIFGILIMPLVKETYVQKENIDINLLEQEIYRLNKDLAKTQGEIDKVSFATYEMYSREVLNMTYRDDTQARPVVYRPYKSLEDAKKEYYGTNIDYMSKSE